MDTTNAIFYIVILIMSIVVHEVAHGFAADRLGDPTARHAGRLTLNPIKHLDLFGSIILPFLLVISHTGLVFGWAKPVPYNPYNLHNKRKGTVIVGLAGIVANLTIAIFFGLVFRLVISLGVLNPALNSVLGTIVFVNLLLAFFNLIPIPPLDGSRVLFAILPVRLRHFENMLERYGFIVLILFIIFLWKYFAPALFFLFSLITGTHI
jgi:Zn-dependent protease